MIVFHQRRDEKNRKMLLFAPEVPLFPCEGGGAGASDCILVQTCDIIYPALLQNKDHRRIKTPLFSARTQADAFGRVFSTYFVSNLCLKNCIVDDGLSQSRMPKNSSAPLFTTYCCCDFMHVTNKG